jgi:predicted aspartyl protease
LSVFTYPIEIAATSAGPYEGLEAYVDSGAFYTQVPASLLRRLGVEAIDEATFITADGNRVVNQLGIVSLRIDGRVRPTVCVFGEEGAPILLGAYALEGFLLGFDPVHETLVQIEGLRL